MNRIACCLLISALLSAGCAQSDSEVGFVLLDEAKVVAQTQRPALDLCTWLAQSAKVDLRFYFADSVVNMAAVFEEYRGLQQRVQDNVVEWIRPTTQSAVFRFVCEEGGIKHKGLWLFPPPKGETTWESYPLNPFVRDDRRFLCSYTDGLSTASCTDQDNTTQLTRIWLSAGVIYERADTSRSRYVVYTIPR